MTAGSTEASQPLPGDPAFAGVRSRITTVALAGLTLSVAVLQTSIAPALPEIQRELGVSTADVTWVLTVTPLVGAVSTPIVGRLGDMFGKRRAISFVVAMTILGCLVSALSHSLGVLILGRTLQGLGGSAFAIGFAIIRDISPAQSRSRTLGMLAGTWGVGAVAGYSLAGFMIDALSYEWIFWLGLMAAAATGAATVACMRESPVRTPARIDWTGAVLLTIGLAAILIANARGLAWGWTSPRVSALFAVGGLALLACGFHERRAPTPFIDLDLLRRRAIWSVNASTVLSAFGLFSFILLVPKLVEGGAAGAVGSATRAGLYLVPLGAANLVASHLAGVRSARDHHRWMNALGSGVCALSLGALAITHGSTAIVLSAAGVGLGFGFVVASTTNAITISAPHRQIGEANALLSLSRQLGGAVGAQIAATLLSISSSPTRLDGGYVPAFGVAAAICLVATAVAFVAPRPRVAPERGGVLTVP